MAKVKCDPDFLVSTLFPGAQVVIEDVIIDAQGYIIFQIKGPDVPDVDEVRAICTVKTITTKFEPIK
jgi:hypothetical protein